MITLTLRYPEDCLPHLTGQDAAEFVLSMMKENPGFALKAATEIEVKGPFGRVVEER